jgi:hypothetical protein
MFASAVAFDANITTWVTSMEGLSSIGMFLGASAWLDKYERTGADGTDYDFDGDGRPDNGPPSAWA